MVGIIVASHGEFAAGIKQSASMILGEAELLESVVFMPSEGPDDLYKKIQDAIEKLGTEEVLFLVDLWGGSPFNQSNRFFEEAPEKRAIVAGLNLPMLLAALSEREDYDTAHEVAKAIVPEGKDQVKVRPEELEPKEAKATAAAQDDTPKGAIPEGTVIGDGKIKFVLARIDTRLLHGQVATSWTKATNPNRIIVVSDSVSKDPRFGNTKALLLFENPQDALYVIEKGVDIKELNVGSMAHTVGKVMVNNVLSMNQKDVDTYKKLRDLGVKFDVRKVAADKRADLFKLISEKANEGLKL